MTQERGSKKQLFFQIGSESIACPKELIVSGVNVRTYPRQS